MTLDELQTAATVWQERLHLQHWQLAVRWSLPHGDLESEDDYGNIFIQNEHRWATIKIRQQMSTDNLFGHGEEHTLVHELLHLHCDPFAATDEPKQLAQEQAINAIADALVALGRVVPLPAVPSYG